MKWTTKAKIQSLVSRLPAPLNYKVYYMMQKTTGTFSRIDIEEFELRKAAELVQLIVDQGHSVEGKTFMEIGTGRTVNTEIGLWLCGAGKVTAVDLNPYLLPELVESSLDWLNANHGKIKAIFSSIEAIQNTLDARLKELAKVERNYDAILRLIGLDYLAPCDAAKMQMPDASLDYHISTNVLEHVPGKDIERIFNEAKRLLKPDGLSVHRVDPSDHFSHSDNTITMINFLEIKDSSWDKIAGNTFSYHNRLRAPDFYKLFEKCGMDILSKTEVVDPRSLKSLEEGFKVDEDFKHFSNEELATTFFTFAGKFSN